MKLFFLMLLCHFIDDFCLQTSILNKLKQKSWWEKELINIPNKELYKNDYLCGLWIHAMEWSLMILLPAMFLTNAGDDILLSLFIVNVIVHGVVDNAKANKGIYNLWQDQIIHFLQIIVTWVILI